MIAATKVYEFDEFRVDTIQRRLSRAGESVPLTSKAFDLLLVLMENAGRDLSKDELLERVWPNQVLEESNLAVNISAIRRALGETAAQSRFIVTIPGYGYRFAARVREASNPMVGLVIERETISRVSFEQTDSASGDGPSEVSSIALPAKRNHLASLISSRAALLTGTVLVIAALAAGGFAWWRRARANALDARFRQLSYKQLTNNGIVYNAALSPDGKLFAFVLVQKEKESLRIGQTNSTDQIELRPAGEVSYAGLVFSHDGSSLFYAFADHAVNKFDLYKISAFGGVPVKLRDNVGSFFAMSPDDKQLAFSLRDPDTPTSSIVVSNLDGSNQTTVTTLPADRGLKIVSVAWSPDGSMIAFGANDGVSDTRFQMYVTRLASHETIPLPAAPWRTIDAARWLKDSSGLTVLAQGAQPGDTTQLWYVPYPTGTVRNLTNDLSTYNVGLGVSEDARSFLLVRLQQINHIWVMPADDPNKARQLTFGTIGSSDGLLGMDWTPDNQLVYASFTGRGQSISSISPDGSNAKQITAPEYEDQVPSVTADGHAMVFDSNRSGGKEIWRADLDGGNAQPLTTCGKNYEPNVSPDGQWVVYGSNCDGIGSLWRVALQGGQPQRLMDQPCAWPSVSPDSQWIACGAVESSTKFRLAILPINGNQPARFFDVAPLSNSRLGFRWSTDGKSIVYRDQRVGLWRQLIDGGPPTRVQGLPAEKIYGFAWSRDGKYFAYTLGTEIRDVVLVSTTNSSLDSLSASKSIVSR